MSVLVQNWRERTYVLILISVNWMAMFVFYCDPNEYFKYSGIFGPADIILWGSVRGLGWVMSEMRYSNLRCFPRTWCESSPHLTSSSHLPSTCQWSNLSSEKARFISRQQRGSCSIWYSRCGGQDQVAENTIHLGLPFFCTASVPAGWQCWTKAITFSGRCSVANRELV